jgi:hypothetical protein
MGSPTRIAAAMAALCLAACCPCVLAALLCSSNQAEFLAAAAYGLLLGLYVKERIYAPLWMCVACSGWASCVVLLWDLAMFWLEWLALSSSKPSILDTCGGFTQANGTRRLLRMFVAASCQLHGAALAVEGGS